MPWHLGALWSGGGCLTWADDFERADLGPDWTAFPYPDESLANPYWGVVSPIIVDGMLQHPHDGSGYDPLTEQIASVYRTDPTPCGAQAIEAEIHHAIQFGGGGCANGRNFRCFVDLILIADPVTGTHMRTRFFAQSGGGVGTDEVWIGLSTQFYYGGLGGEAVNGESILYGPTPCGAVGEDNVYFVNAVINRSNGHYLVTLGGTTAVEGFWPIEIPWGNYQGISVRWDLGTAIDGDFVSPAIEVTNGGGYTGGGL